MENHPAGRVYRAELTRLGLPQPETLRGIDIIEEAIRLVGVPLLPTSALSELPPNGETNGRQDGPSQEDCSP